jgi:hypothetical protein
MEPQAPEFLSKVAGWRIGGVKFCPWTRKKENANA